MLNKLKNLVREEEGQGMAEYGLILAAIAVVCAGVFFGLGDKVKGIIEGISFTKSSRGSTTRLN